MKNFLGNLLIVLSILVTLGILGFEFMQFTNSFSKSSLQQTAGLPNPRDPNEKLALIDRGRIVFQQSGCQACHIAKLTKDSPEAGGPIGPSFSNVGVRRKDTDWLTQQITAPQSVVPRTKMPSFAYLSKEQIETLIAYVGTMDQNYYPVTEPNLQIPKDANKNPRYTQEMIDKGMNLFNSNGCIGCHMIGKQGAPLGPNLTHEALRGRSDEWQLNHLKDPLSVYVLGPTDGIQWIMPKFGQLSEEDLKALVAYLQSLH
ncbi:cytochrome c [Candidatus Acetothermia bacterium]|nr:cytochrome c [Candidatus Acetothermia bacterium]